MENVFCPPFCGDCCSQGVPPKENKSDETQEQSGSPIIDYEVPDKVKDYDFDYEFVPEGE